MQTYLVGGAVRDKLLNIDNYDQDWVVVGATPQTLLSLGYQAVGKDFPVFLHPKTNEEYALARTERKSGTGYTGFDCHFAEDVTLEEDLIRRDLTINAIAQDSSGELYDPYGGQQDIQNKLLRHVSDAFVEDPLRVLRVARFAAKLHHLGFSVAEETQTLMSEIVESGELETLTAERVWQEWQKSLLTQDPQIFVQVLQDCGALEVVIPELSRLFGVPQTEKWHPEIDTGIHTIMVAKRASELTTEPEIRFAAQMHDLGKGVTPEQEWPSHKMHCHTGLKIIEKLSKRLRVPNQYKELALHVCKQHSNIHRAQELKASTLLRVLDSFDVWRKPAVLEQVLITCQADSQGRLGHESTPYPQRDYIKAAYQSAISVNVQQVIQGGFSGKEIREELNRRRVDAIDEIKQGWLWD
ncbi:multifunctional CCA addition/repair protein [Vibrio breoganii]|uniref:Multifunctional CCA protein n=1 Tax=Vibrio breoganii TaxID=553239 RepID=A0AAP8SYI3_9VIBR|nr:multifunctional CCA addition/repair protein [Vibrio breoganii]PMH16643.1 multifunctional CCA tRNA nucleotidyl transferase/2'3'-cyclic phosphodiesterase/2'nucleotidase/phosphatase [Vibrio breoganii]PMK58707.1 multifunctional CCA tRNA nucleotidyl transferase/2'3'-cyclic phosphodiesterase/2'nucleotidase/phosphatase [Vibrio breoganii]PMK80288.1 multifunctional CCA tRNA nucleotidyl transferase/2'3'-cyclic phosphodiesterase/2'nucleotidase/phosphatase [Vibrio breoganii]PMM16227.1 multifunctional CC